MKTFWRVYAICSAWKVDAGGVWWPGRPFVRCGLAWFTRHMIADRLDTGDTGFATSDFGVVGWFVRTASTESAQRLPWRWWAIFRRPARPPAAIIPGLVLGEYQQLLA